MRLGSVGNSKKKYRFEASRRFEKAIFMCRTEITLKNEQNLRVTEISGQCGGRGGSMNHLIQHLPMLDPHHKGFVIWIIRKKVRTI